MINLKSTLNEIESALNASLLVFVASFVFAFLMVILNNVLSSFLFFGISGIAATAWLELYRKQARLAYIIHRANKLIKKKKLKEDIVVGWAVSKYNKLKEKDES